ncbi:AAA ATPase family protein [Abortiporus biennis]
MDALNIVQEVFTVFSNHILTANNSVSNSDPSINGTISLSSPTPVSTLPQLIAMLVSFSALREWLKLIFIGGAIETLRRSIFRLWDATIESLWITASFDQDDSSFDWIMFWLSRHPKWKKARKVEVTTRSFGLDSRPGEYWDEPDTPEKKKISYLPSVSESYSLWHKGRYMIVTRSKEQTNSYRTTESIRIRMFARSQSALNDLVSQAKEAYLAAQEHLVSVYVSNASDNWRHVASRPKRPLTSIVLDPGVKDLLLEDARDFLDSKSWYVERGIPFRRGYLLYGAPGSGKTSMIQSIAGELGLNVYIISLSRSGLDDTTLSELISELPERCIALMEDIDAAFNRGITRKFGDTNSDGDANDGEEDKTSTPASRITLSGLLNALDGIGAQEGRILFATTNCYSSLDPALCRPGRMDLHIEFKLASKYQAEELFKRFYLPTDADDDVSDKTESDSIKNDPDIPVDPSSSSSSAVDSLETDPFSTLVDFSDDTKPLLFHGTSHRLRAPRLAKSTILALSSQFSSIIPEREFSMASLQGYLMTYKTRPVQAVADAESWVAREREGKSKLQTQSEKKVTAEPGRNGTAQRGGRGRGRGRGRRR